MGILQLDNPQKGLRFDGVNDYVLIPFNNAFNFNITSMFSISFIFSMQSFKDFSCILHKGGANLTRTDGYLCGIANNNILSFNTLQSTPYKERANNATIPTLSINTIYNAVIVYNNQVVEFYLNGVKYTTNSSGAFPDSIVSTMDMSIGQYRELHGSYQPNATIYDLKIFNKSLSQSEVSHLYNSKNNIIPSTATNNIVSNYQFNQQSGTSLTDFSGNNITGTLTNYTTLETTIGSSNKWLYQYNTAPFDNSRKSGVLLINNN